ncbi:MAG: hypothetical protein H8E35_07585 [Ardenticatenia bacterium]|nr:hypothetical protein [Ardenticatenia bacterium]
MISNDESVPGSFRWEPGQTFETTNAFHQPRRYHLDRFLGGGATSLVWLAQEFSVDGEVQRPEVALKVLKPETEAQWREAFEDEIRVLRTLWTAEEQLRDGRHAIPEVYDISPEETSPAYLAMEYVPHPSVDELALPPSELPSQLADLAKTGTSLLQQLSSILADLSRVADVSPELAEMVAHLSEQDLGSVERLKSTAHEVEAWFREHQGLSEEEVALVGTQVCRVLQLLHESGRSYQDFQLHNVRWDQEKQRIKVIDWNVVTPPGQVNLSSEHGLEHVRRDLARLASYLFWLRTLVRAPEAGAPPRTLARLGGRAWSEHTSLALRLVLERALDPDPNKRYARAYDASERGHSLVSFSELSSLGAALDLVARWHSAPAGELVGLAGQYRESAMVTETLALIELARQRLDREPSDVRDSFLAKLDELEEMIALSTSRPSFELGCRLLDAGDAARAAEAFGQAVAETPDDLEAYRWLALARSLRALRLEEFEQLWKSDRLQVAMGALMDERWDEALQALETAEEDAAELDLSVLLSDARLGSLLAKAERQWLALQASGEQAHRNRAWALATAQSLLKTSKEVDELLSGQTTHPYIRLVSQRWPNWGFWREQAQTVLNQLENDGVIQRRGKEGKRLLHDGKPDEAVEVLRDALQYSGDTSDVVALRGHLKTAEAWIQLREALRVIDNWGPATSKARWGPVPSRSPKLSNITEEGVSNG